MNPKASPPPAGMPQPAFAIVAIYYVLKGPVAHVFLSSNRRILRKHTSTLFQQSRAGITRLVRQRREGSARSCARLVRLVYDARELRSARCQPSNIPLLSAIPLPIPSFPCTF